MAMVTRNLLLCSLALPLLIIPASAEEQSWVKRTPPPVRYASPPPEQKEHDWSGFHMGVNAGAEFNTNNRNSVMPGGLNFPR
jgi:hypothetical protein